jgi:hypothetical protein
MLVTLTPTAKHRGEEAVVMRIGFAALVFFLGLLVARQFLAPPPPAPVTSAAIIAPSSETQPALLAPPVQVTAAAVDPLPDTDTALPQEVVRGMAETAGEEVSAPPVSEAVLACQQIWHPSTHMSREEWAQSCRRVESKNAETAETEATTATGEVTGRPRDQRSRW